MNNTYDIQVDDHEEKSLNWRELKLDICDIENNRISLLDNNINYDVELVSIDLQSKQLSLKVNGLVHRVTIKDELDRTIQSMGLETSAISQVNQLVAPMPGQVKEILVQTGDSIEEGQPMMVLVAMKMENLLKSPCACTVKAINCKAEEIVAKDDVLIEFS